MIKTCSNCAGRLVYDIAKRGVKCCSCESVFTVEEIPEVNDQNNLETSDKIQRTMDCNVYTCNSCGAEIVINDTEASTFCVYCGNPSIVFSRMTSMKRPECIIPFTVTREQAEQIIRERIGNGRLVPEAIKNFTVETLRPIYIPYYITDISCAGSAIMSSVVGSGKNSHTYYYFRKAQCDFTHVSTDASKKLADSSSERLEPFNYKKIVEFDEDYLLGFYADMSDVPMLEAQNTARSRAVNLFEQSMIESVKEGSNKKVDSKRLNARINGNSRTALFPAWFLTFRYEDQPYTILVNGQTGKVVGGVPWDKPKYTAIYVGLMVILTAILTLVFAGLFYAIGHIDDSDSAGDLIEIVIFICIFAGGSFSTGLKRLKSVKKSIERTTATTLTSFANKRQSVD